VSLFSEACEAINGLEAVNYAKSGLEA